MSYIGQSPNNAEFIRLDDISASFNGSTVEFDVTSSGNSVNIPSPKQCLISLNNIILESGVDFTIGTTSNKLRFTVAPVSGQRFFALIIARAYQITTLNGTVSSSNIDDSAITNAKIANNTINNTKLLNNTITNAKIADNTITLQKIADNAVIPSKVSTVVNDLGTLTGGTANINLNTSRYVRCTISTATTTFTITNPKATGNADQFYMRITNGGTQTLNFPTSVSWGVAGAPTLVTSGVNILEFITFDGGTTWQAFKRV